jgi:hypothetical protein
MEEFSFYDCRLHFSARRLNMECIWQTAEKEGIRHRNEFRTQPLPACTRDYGLPDIPGSELLAASPLPVRSVRSSCDHRASWCTAATDNRK